MESIFYEANLEHAKRQDSTLLDEAAFILAGYNQPDLIEAPVIRPKVENMRLWVDHIHDIPGGTLHHLGHIVRSDGTWLDLSQTSEATSERKLSNALFLNILNQIQGTRCIWALFPNIRVIDAAYILATKQEPPDDAQYIDDAPSVVRNYARYIAKKTSAFAPESITVCGNRTAHFSMNYNFITQDYVFTKKPFFEPCRQLNQNKGYFIPQYGFLRECLPKRHFFCMRQCELRVF